VIGQDIKILFAYRLAAPLARRDSPIHRDQKIVTGCARTASVTHAGAPTGVGLAWMHLGASDEPEHIIEKTGGGAGFLTYLAIHPASHTALFLASTDGLRGAGTRGFNLFKAANNALLALAGLPPLQEEIHEVHPAPRVVRTAHHGSKQHAAKAKSKSVSSGKSR
jgi:D-alanyl-D-alanine-carboxypeptidase/D-alanyl-D-alanine-endopeptidase